MAWPVPTSYPITTAYGKRGSHWSCNENSSGQGIHTGVDMAAPSGTPLYATIAGQIRHRNYGSAFGGHQFAISPDADQPFAKGEVFYAHARKRLADGTYVEVGDWVGEVGAEGNVTGPHLHYEFHPNHKNAWNCSVVADPAPTLSHESGGGSSHYVTEDIYSNKLGYGEPTNGDESSDTIKELQERLNRISLEGGQNLTVNGVYDNDTDDEVRKWQEQVCGDVPDPAGASYLGPAQMAEMFPDSIYTLHDTGLPAIANGGGDPDGGGGGGGGATDPCAPPVDVSSWGDMVLTALGDWEKVSFQPAWDDPDIAGNGEWEPEFVVTHHTAGTNSLSWLASGGDHPPVPGANFLISKDGTIHVLSSRISYHAGKGGPYEGVSVDMMNHYAYGIEVESLGQTKDFTQAQHDAIVHLSQGLLGVITETSDKVLNHKTWSSTGKTDTLYTDEYWRSLIDGETTPPEPEPGCPTSIAVGDVYLSKLHYGQLDSDSVARMQQELNKLMGDPCYPHLELCGNYDDETDDAVRAWQESIGDTPDPEGESFLGPRQADLLFEGTGNTVIDDTGEEPPDTGTPPPEQGEVTVNGGHCHDIQKGMDEAANVGKTLRLTGTFAVYTNVYIPDDLNVVATGAKFYVNSETAKEKATYNAGRFRNATNNDAAGYGQAGWFVWTGGEFDGNGEGIFTISHSPGFTIKDATMYNYCSSGNTGHAIEINSSGGNNDLNGPYNVKILDSNFLGTDRGQRSNSNDEPVHWDWNWDGSGAAAPVWKPGNPVNETTQTMCHNVLVEGNLFHRKVESGSWQFAKTAIGGHDASDPAFDPEYRHNHILVKGNTIHGAVGSTEVSPNKGAIHLCWTRDARVENNMLHGGVNSRYVTAENEKDSTYCTATGNNSASPTLSNPNKIVVEG